MVKHLAEAGGEESRGESAAGGRGGVRFLHSEAAPSAQRRLLGLALLDLRLKAGLKQEEVARRLNASESKISRIETGTFKAKSADLERLLTAYAVSDPAERERLRTLAAVANEPAWWQSYTGVTQRYLQAMVSYEELAERVKSYEPLVLHGQLQTAAYGRALISRARGDAQSHEELWQFRAERQRRFAAAANKSFIGVVDEGALRRPVGSSAIMLEQIEHLLCLMDSGRYQLRLAEQANPHVHAEVGPTTIFDFAERIMPSVVYSELFEGGVIIQDEDMVDRRVREFDALQYASLAPAATRRKLQQLRSLYR